MTDFNDAQYKLERELVAAGHRLQAKKANKSPSRMLVRLGGPVMAGLVLVVGFIGVGLIRQPTPASAFKITELTNRVELEVIDIITSPQEVSQQLINELDLPSELYSVPVHPDLVGQIISAGTTGDSAPVYQTQPDGTVDIITLDEGFNGILIIEYGRAAELDEIYKATVPNPLCSQLWGQTLEQSLPVIEEQVGNIQFETIDQRQATDTDVEVDSVDPTYGLTDVTNLSSNSVIVTYSANPANQPRTHPNCQ